MNPPIKKPPVNGKAKGSGFESTIAKKFSEAFAPLNFKRVPQSGAYAGGQNVQFNHLYSNATLGAFVGDIFPANEADVEQAEAWRFRFTIECKFYKEADNFSALFKNPQLIGWWEQATADAAKLKDKHPMLVFKFNHTPIYAGVDPLHTPLPNNIQQTLTLRYYANDTQRTLELCVLDDLLKESSWWKMPLSSSL